MSTRSAPASWSKSATRRAADRLARLRLAVLPRVREQRDDGGDALRGRRASRPGSSGSSSMMLRSTGSQPVCTMNTSGAADRLEVAAVGLAVRRTSSARPRRAPARASPRSAPASAGCERPEKSIRRRCGPALDEVLRACVHVLAPAGRLQPRQLGQLNRPAGRRHTPPLLTCLGGKPASEPGGTSSVITVPAASHASSPISTGATKTLWIAVLTLLPIAVRRLRQARPVRVVGRDAARADVRPCADVRVPDVGQVRNLRAFAHPRVLDLDERARLGARLEHRAGAKVTERSDGRPRTDRGVDRARPVGRLRRRSATRVEPRRTVNGWIVQSASSIDAGVDPRGRRVDDAGAGAHVRAVDPVAQRGGCGGELARGC